MERILDWNKYLDTAAKMVSEGIVMLKNENNALPLDTDKEVAVFGRIQFHYYKSGTGSGGMVNVTKVVNILDGLIDNGVKVNEKLLDTYRKWDKENPFDLGEGWGGEPWSQKEMPLDEGLVKETAKSCETAIVIIGRTAGEEQDNRLEAGSYLLSDDEIAMLTVVRKHFKKVVLLLNVGNIIDMTDINRIAPDSVLYVWQGGMTGGKGTADVLTGKVSPSGKLPDTIAYKVSDYPSDANFGREENRDIYAEDIYVGYRYFETFAKEKVLYPFGFGLSYTEFEIKTEKAEITEGAVKLSVSVKNIGSYKGKEVIEVYCEAPQGRLGKAARVLCGFEKTRELVPQEEQVVEIAVDIAKLASYDDSGVTGNKSCYVLEAGKYKFYVGSDVRSAEYACSFEQGEDLVTERLTQSLAPVESFERIKPVCEGGAFSIGREAVPVSEVDESARRLEKLPKEIAYTGDKGIKLWDVKNGKNTMDEFIAQLSDYDLSCIIRGEGMGSPRVTAGTASAFGGVSENLNGFGIPAGCCSDGPSGMRLDCGTKAFSLPNGTMIASSFNKELTSELFTFMGLEMAANKVDCLLGPGMNIHRHPLNGRNFEYFSEDPFLTGKMAAAELKGMAGAGVTGTIKHFCANNRETNRHFIDSVVSERALREIYLKGFEIAVKEGGASSVMTTYGRVNGLWTAGNFDLNTVILREEWGFKGFTMTDWWANINVRGKEPDKTDFAAMARAQNDVYMVCPDGEKNDDNTLAALENGGIERCELQRNAENICGFLLHTNALKRAEGIGDTVKVINREDEEQEDDKPVQFYKVDRDITLDLSDVETKKGTSYSFALDLSNFGIYRVIVTASSTQSELAQIPMTLFSMGTAVGTFTFNGTGGKAVSMEKETPMFSRFTTFRIYFAQNGLELHSIRFELTDKKR
ncbi:glycoside hydrolase family 3 C-terminal domain-containing protein [Ruminococcus bicirculans]|uniref:Glycoside hydrolase family 3 C-terminal domain-containing protein n=1 Tax=Ruminococcus bicirculans (ex Wegman et al. 2014) TaxID=1160721 RepID=A0AAW6EGJ4_9FIRM|nr:glycoside hydrolase family 3 protein [Ruminococcus bicirculans (ex Wegman et al. 2014)]MDB8750995.1 glycoside hydrolase family 3 C-terminal domain-containing protein [Ruminococcus bicirculans (ex Wegman et al. 2014)]